MSIKEYNLDRRAFVDYLKTRPRDEASRLIGLLAIGAVKALRADYSLWPTVARSIFNGTVLLFCKDILADEDATEMINYAIQIDDLKGFTDNFEPFNKMCSDVEARAMNLIARNRVKTD